MANDTAKQEANTAGDQTSSTNDNQDNQPSGDNKPEDNQQDDSLETLKAQKNHWRENAIDPETGKKYKDLYLEAQKSTKAEDKTSKNEKSSSKKEEKAEEFGLLQKTFLASNGITDEEEVELAKDIQRRTGVDWDKLPNDEYFKFQLEKHRESAANAKATNVEGGGGGDSAVKESPDYWEKQGNLPNAKQIPDRKKRVEIIKELRRRAENQGGKFYNE